MLAFYLVVSIVICMIWYAGYEGTMRVFTYTDLSLRYAWIQMRMFFMRQRLKRDLKKAGLEYEKLFKDVKK